MHFVYPDIGRLGNIWENSGEKKDFNLRLGRILIRE